MSSKSKTPRGSTPTLDRYGLRKYNEKSKEVGSDTRDVHNKINMATPAESSHSSNKVNNEELMKAIRKVEEKVSESERRILDNITEQFNKKFSDLEQSLQYAYEEIDGLKKENQELKNELIGIKTDQELLTKDMSTLKRDSLVNRRNKSHHKIRVSGVAEKDGENCKVELAKFIIDNELITDKSEEEISQMFEVAGRTGKRREGNNRQILATCYSRDDRNMLVAMGKRKAENGSNLIHEDFIPEDYEIRKKALPLMKKAYQDGKRCRFVDGQLFVEGVLVKLGTH